MKKISLLGSTGSIGRQVIEVCRKFPDKFKIIALCAGRESKLFSEQVKTLAPKYSATAQNGAEKLAALDEADIVFNAVSGFAGLKYSVSALSAGKTVALANKETLVCGGQYILNLANICGGDILPVDSEHSAIWQCLDFGNKLAKKLIITASGGPFRDKNFAELENITPEQALNHPTWNMGAKITVDSATLMNKAYEVIEAHALFGNDYKDIKAVIHPQSVVHSMVQFSDGSILAQMGLPNMKLPIQLALSYPERLEGGARTIDFSSALSLDFQPLDEDKFPCFKLGIAAGKAGGIMPCALNAADEVAVNAFLDKKIAFTQIPQVVEGVLEKTQNASVSSYSDLVEADERAREIAVDIIKRFK